MHAQTPSVAVSDGCFCCCVVSGLFRCLRLALTQPFRMVYNVGETLSSSSASASHENLLMAVTEDCLRREQVFLAHSLVISF